MYTTPMKEEKDSKTVLPLEIRKADSQILSGGPTIGPSHSP